MTNRPCCWIHLLYHTYSSESTPVVSLQPLQRLATHIKSKYFLILPTLLKIKELSLSLSFTIIATSKNETNTGSYASLGNPYADTGLGFSLMHTEILPKLIDVVAIVGIIPDGRNGTVQER